MSYGFSSILLCTSSVRYGIEIEIEIEIETRDRDRDREYSQVIDEDDGVRYALRFCLLGLMQNPLRRDTVNRVQYIPIQAFYSLPLRLKPAATPTETRLKRVFRSAVSALTDRVFQHRAKPVQQIADDVQI